MKRARSLTFAMAWLLATGALADVLVLHDGRRIPGEVTATADGYSVKTRFGTTIAVEANEVREWIKGNAAGASAPVKPAPRPAATTTTAATTQAASRPSRTIDALLRQGSDALMAKEYRMAREIFADAASIEPRNVKALHGLALSLMYLNDFKGAQVHMERALAFAGAKPDRAMILNNAMLQIALNNPMRALKFTREYIEAHFTAVDEPMLNALGSALFLADDNARKNMLWNSTVDFYLKYQRAIEATRPGMKRWGVEWLPAGEVDNKFGEMRKKEAVADRINQQIDLAEERVIRAKRQLRQARADQIRGNASALEANMAQVNLTEKLVEFHNLAKAYEEAMDEIVRPTWPRVLTPVALDETSPPGAEAANLAMNDPVFKEAMTKANKAVVAKRVINDPDEPPKAATQPAAPPPAVLSLKTEKATKVKLTLYAAAFAVSPDLVITAAAPLEKASEFELQSADGAAIRAEVVRTDAKTGLALLKVTGRTLAYLSIADKQANAPIACAGFPQVNLFNPMPEMIAGISNPAKEGAWTVKLARHPRLLASPLLCNRKIVGAVMGMRDHGAESLPVVPLDGIKALLGEDLKPAVAGAAADPMSAVLQLIATREVAAGE